MRISSAHVLTFLTYTENRRVRLNNEIARYDALAIKKQLFFFLCARKRKIKIYKTMKV